MWHNFQLDINTLASENGLGLNNTFVIKFSRFGAPGKWFGIDDIEITGADPYLWSGEVHLYNDFVVPSSETLTIAPGTTVYMEDSSRIFVNGGGFQVGEYLDDDDEHITTFVFNKASVSSDVPGQEDVIGNGIFINGYCNAGIFNTNFSGPSWDGIKIDQHASASIWKCTFENAGTHVTILGATAYIQNSHFLNGGIGVYVSNGWLNSTNNSYFQNANVGIYIDNGVLVLQNDTIDNCFKGFEVYNSIFVDPNQEIHQYNHIYNSTVRNCYFAGTIYNSQVNLGHADIGQMGNTFADNEYGLLILNRSLVYSYDSIIYDSRTTDGHPEIMFTNDSNFYLESDPSNQRRNTISDLVYQANGYDQPLIRCLSWDNHTIFDISGNEWCDYTEADLSVLQTRLEPLAAFDYLPLFDPGTSSPAEVLFKQAELAYKSEDFTTAKNLYEQIVALYPSSNEAKMSLSRLFALEKETTQDYDNLITYYETQPNSSYDEKMEKTTEHFVTQSYVEKGDYETAVQRLEAIIANPTSEEEYAFAVIDLGYVYLRMAEDDEAAGTLSVIGSMPEHRPLDLASHQATTNNLLSHLASGTLSSGDNPIVTIPDPDLITATTHYLAQNYPNPFNPTTMISFQLPIDCGVSLKIYNSSGQLVKSLVNSHLSSGSHEVAWGGQNEAGQPVGSGIYFYRLTTDGGYDELKSMILLK